MPKLKKRTQVIRFIEQKLEGNEGLLIWFHTSMDRVNFTVLTEAPKHFKEKYLKKYGDRLQEFRGMHETSSTYTYKTYTRRYKRFYDKAGFNYYEKEIVLNDNNETIESLAWLLLHELGHSMVNKFSNYPWFNLLGELNSLDMEATKKRLNIENYWSEYLTNDEVHESRPEEQFCNLIATSIIGVNRDRFWWRENCYQGGSNND